MEEQTLRISGYPDTRIPGALIVLRMRKLILYLVGSFMLVLGIALVLRFWADVVLVFRAGIGIALALAGLLVLYSLNRE